MVNIYLGIFDVVFVFLLVFVLLVLKANALPADHFPFLKIGS
ncbi:putative membrane protein [Synechococcus sp. PROS-9-1]|nr:putative membrane protein [Synechococcus sp. PROS-9-1]